MRETFQDALDQVSNQLVDMTNLAGSAISRATTALMDADIKLAESVIDSDDHIDQIRVDIEAQAFDLLARQQPVATDLRVVVTALQMATDLERMGDLAAHIAKVARMRYPNSALPQPVRPVILEMAQSAQRNVAKAGSAIASRDAERAHELEEDDDSVDRQHRELFRILLDPKWSHGIEAAIDITLLGRYYERFSDHAVAVARRVIYIVTGERSEQTASAGSLELPHAIGVAEDSDEPTA
ncbi:phosphate signaling complex protein PhoU [Blastococcus sp. Marseille-P5729]|uniref:phosphate signaling complex protein PhoU n=1 Tax=Blastococcus sp. Marseille-P5729 TaxID=2086582 RepID=UPI000D0E978C|nr:phosphate signaling complex protein PhoU [Blastococcus sp. Marseille-P5729]